MSRQMGLRVQQSKSKKRSEEDTFTRKTQKCHCETTFLYSEICVKYNYSVCVCVSCSVVSDSLRIAHQAPLSMEFSRQEYWSGLPFPSSGDLPNLGIELASLTSPELAGGFFTTSVTGNP